MNALVSKFWRSSLLRWLLTDQGSAPANPLDIQRQRIDVVRCLPFFALHVGCLAVWWVGISATAVLVALGLYLLRMFLITAFYHRYFAHRAFKTSRLVQAVAAALACTAGQRGPLWWAAHHRHHHKHSDQDQDIHSPHIVSLLRSHMGWFMTPAAFATRDEYIRDWQRYPELRWLNRFDWAPFLLLGGILWLAGALLERTAPQLGVTGAQLFVWGFCLSTVLVYHATYTINSLAHRFGSRRYATADHSRNNLWLALLTLGEGWHNNHHHYPGAARQGFYWWEIDLTWYLLLLLERLGVVRDLRPVPAPALGRNRVESATVQEAH